MISADCPFTIQLTLDRPNFLIGLPNNTFKVGIGDPVNGDTIDPVLYGTDRFPEELDTLDYNNSGSSSIWIQIDVSDGFFWFDIAYIVTDAKEGKYLKNADKILFLYIFFSPQQHTDKLYLSCNYFY